MTSVLSIRTSRGAGGGAIWATAGNLNVTRCTFDQNIALWVIGLVTAILTAFYMSRQVFMTFYGEYRYADVRPEEIQEIWDNRIAAARFLSGEVLDCFAYQGGFSLQLAHAGAQPTRGRGANRPEVETVQRYRGRRRRRDVGQRGGGHFR